VVDLWGYRVGLSICEDIWNEPELFPHLLYNLDPVEELVRAKIDILVNISSSPYFMRKRLIRERLLRKISKKYSITTVYVNQVGGNDDLLFDGVSMVFDSLGRMKARALEFESDLVVWDSESNQGEIREIPHDAETSVLEGLVMGVRDYFRKCGFKKALVGLSGGIDSSLVAAIAARALGSENVMGLSMPSPYTSAMSREDSRLLAQNLGIYFEEIPISPIFEAYLKQLLPLFKGLKENEAEENIQARIRGNLLMAISNKFGHLVLSTGNKSEIAVGYCTLYGDMSGGLAVISDVPKTMCYALARCINRDREVIPQRVLTRPPSAELKPGQKDQDTLPPYEILDAILHAYVEDHKGLEAIVGMGYDEETVRFVIRRVNQNEYKRLQMAPGLKITYKAFGSGRRYPIAKGSYNS
jgi:NAD+ synthetase